MVPLKVPSCATAICTTICFFGCAPGSRVPSQLPTISVASAAIVGAGIIPHASISTTPKPSQRDNARCFFIIHHLSRTHSQNPPNEVRQQDQKHETPNPTNPEHKVESQPRRIDFFLVHCRISTLLPNEPSLI